jgi:SAM-dependent methyltransferase
LSHNQPPDFYHEVYFRGRGLRHRFHRCRVDALLDLVGPAARVLDAGCGSGLTCHLLARRGCAVTGADLDEAEVAFARELTPAGRFLVADLERLELGERFDVVLCSETLEHFTREAQARVLERLAAHVAPGGRLVLTFPSRLYFALEPAWRLCRRLAHPGVVWDDAEHHGPVARAALRDRLGRLGLRVAGEGRMVHGLIAWVVAEGVTERSNS